MTAVTPEDVGRTTFALTPPGLRGYHTDEVDAFLELVAATLGGSGVLTADDLRHVSFGAPRGGRRGYRAEQVDEFLDRVHAELEFRQRGVRPVPAAPPGPAPARLLTPADVHRMRFTPAPLEQRGYHVEEVDAFLDLVAATLAHDGPGSLTVEDVRAVRFTVARLGVRGYQRDEVDAFLDLVVTALQQPAALR
ncbi:DivIVA domain-containing protein [Nocardia cyriacigeorgica]|jgi:DivIVA domain-containing protein|uniref:DivIVA domain-containing protein n=1 Tax=Nocardia cyriacigeorgica TaxID=135487 RepID=UPI0013D6ECF6|nr:DivIVA domain-containing protein [Nocardia cyriacigeorgica]MBF6454059.1 DivIVA domain-containing protein [Nocardia cyriacigeorgica]MBF6481268.1 DivIVA domain-containing protein [Nocardia cyriacigeorgica]MBF6551953.1 DivIVA domain-containing protein [Nocardia cyriacigeorgica]NEW28342.1 DivIVA domain-containing protein [Nocardia cyriacigeorgica]